MKSEIQPRMSQIGQTMPNIREEDTESSDSLSSAGGMTVKSKAERTQKQRKRNHSVAEALESSSNSSRSSEGVGKKVPPMVGKMSKFFN